MNTHSNIPLSADNELLPITVDFNDPNFGRKIAESIHKTGFGIVRIPNGQLGIYQHELMAAVQENRDFVDNLTYEQVMQGLFLHDENKDAGIFPFGAEGRTEGPPNLYTYLHHRKDTRDTEDNRRRKAFTPFVGHDFPMTWSLFNGMERLNLYITDALVEHMPDTPEWATVRANMKYMRNNLESKQRSVVRFIKYVSRHDAFPDAKPDIDPEDNVPVWNDRHEDADWLTLIPAQTKPGLQLRDNNGKWYNIPWTGEKDDGYIYIVVNAGDTLSAASGGQFALCRTIKGKDGASDDKNGDPLTFDGWRNAEENAQQWRDRDAYRNRRLRLVKQGYYPSTTHRVVAPAEPADGSTVVRYSMPFFFHVNGWIKVQGVWTARDKLRGYVRNKEAQRVQATARIEQIYRTMQESGSHAA